MFRTTPHSRRSIHAEHHHRPIRSGESIDDGYAGYIEGIRDDGSTWIMWLDAAGSPESYWARREPDGGVTGEPVMLAPETP